MKNLQTQIDLLTKENLRLREEREELVREVATQKARDKVAEHEIQRAREKGELFWALLMKMSDVAYRMSPDWTEMHQLLGREFIADTMEKNRDWLLKYIPAEDQPQVIEAIEKAIRTKDTFEL